MTTRDPTAVTELTISTDQVCYIILKAREFGEKVDPVIDDPGSNPADDGERDILEDRADDPTAAELAAAIDTLNDDEAVDLVALAWVGRGDFTRKEWHDARKLAAERHHRRASSYLLGIPLLGDYLEEGLAELGHSCEGYADDRL